MVIFGILFVATSFVTTSLLTTVFTNTVAINTILALVLFMGLGLMFVQQTKRWAWTIFVGAIILMVAVQTLAPYQEILTNVVATIIAVIGLVNVKRPMLRFVRNNEKSQNPLPTWTRWILRLI